MSTRRLVKSFQKLFKLIWKLSRAITKSLMKWLLRSLFVLGRRRRFARAGFVLPTVTMVTLVVVLLTTAILIRSFDRAKNASNFRVNRAVLAAATPAIDRARAKIEAVFKDPTLPRSTPSDTALYSAFRNNTYTFGDETRLKLAYDFGDGKGGSIPNTKIDTNTPQLEQDETLNTAWRFPVDTDNNGKYDSYTLYSINFRSPTRDGNNFNRDRSPLDARTPPMDQGQVGGKCAAAIGNSASLVGDTDWYKSGSNLKKSFFVFVATVPITGTPPATNVQGREFESYRGNQGFSGLEYQMDKSIVPLTNNAVWFEDDIEISDIGGGFRLNGRVFTNSNLLVRGAYGNVVDFYQVSSPESCYYEQENAKILVGGNVANDGIETSEDADGISVHLFKGADANPQEKDFGNGLKSTNENGGTLVAYNTQAYARRIGAMVDAAMEFAPAQFANGKAIAGVAQYPEQVKERFEGRFGEKAPRDILSEELENYFRERTRRVPYAEVPFGEDALGGVNENAPFGGTNPVQPPDAWMLIDNANLNLAYLPATEPTLQQQLGEEVNEGDRILVGNNLPDRWYKGGGEFAEEGEEQPIEGQNWTEPNNEQRERTSQIETQPDLGNIERNGFWEQEAAKLPGQNENTGGLRVITGAGIYGYPGSLIPALDTTAGTNPSFLPDLNDLTNLGNLTQISANGTFDPVFLATLDANVLDANVNVLPPNTTVVIPDSQVSSPVAPFRLVWPDTMPMTTPDDNTNGFTDTPTPSGISGAISDNLSTIQIEGSESKQLPDLRMRATAVYHYAVDAVGPNDTEPDQLPIACVSSYLDPTNPTTARNPATDLNGNPLPDVSGGIDTDGNGIIDILADGSIPGTQPAIFADGAKSNNGVSYSSPYSGGARSYTTYDAELRQQASMMFPNGRLANKPLYDAFIKIDNGVPLTLADYSAIDSTVCALGILDGTLTPNATVIPHGAIKEAAFLDGRQVKSLKAVPDDTNTILEDENITYIASLTRDLIDTTYDLQLEQRQPLEIRVTELDLNLLRQTQIGNPTNAGANDPNNNQEFLIPNSGIIYASRDDALPDLSAAEDDDNTADVDELMFPDLGNLTTEAKLVSREDFKLDPTRRPNGIRLINGANLARETFDRIAEKGLILVSNLPVYVKGDFNIHDYEEFTQALTPGTWNNFYDRKNLDDRFACRPGRPGCNPNQGDDWRSATIISDAVTLLSGGLDKGNTYKEGFKDGFRVDGDYDLRNNAGNSVAQARLNRGFWFNNFVTSADWDVGVNATVPDGFPDDDQKTSYVTNGVTPIQRRAEFPEYLMEVCPKVPVSTCEPNDWYLDPGDPLATDIGGLPAPIDQVKISTALLGVGFDSAIHRAGTTAVAAAPELQGFPRRLAFLRSGSNLAQANGSPIASVQIKDTTGARIPLTPATSPVPLGIDAAGNIQQFPYTDTALPRIAGTGTPPEQALWFFTTDNQTDPGDPGSISFDNASPLYIYQMPSDNAGNLDPEGQPLLVPVLQIHNPEGTPNNTAQDPFNGFIEEKWLQVSAPADQAGTTANTFFNAAFVSGDTPSRPGESGGGLHNFVRFLENWKSVRDNKAVAARTAGISGSFIQTRRSAYATAPMKAIDQDGTNIDTSLFYNNGDNIYNAIADKNIEGFRYSGGAFASKSPFYMAPTREWGFDVALLTQLPDLFAQQFTSDDDTDPQEFFREVGRDDPWIETLLCAGAADDRFGIAGGVGFEERAVSNPPQECPTIPANPA